MSFGLSASPFEAFWPGRRRRPVSRLHPRSWLGTGPGRRQTGMVRPRAGSDLQMLAREGYVVLRLSGAADFGSDGTTSKLPHRSVARLTLGLRRAPSIETDAKDVVVVASISPPSLRRSRARRGRRSLGRRHRQRLGRRTRPATAWRRSRLAGSWTENGRRASGVRGPRLEGSCETDDRAGPYCGRRTTPTSTCTWDVIWLTA